MPAADAPNLNHCWSALLVEELVRCGVSSFVLSPGSRSTPLTLAVAAHPGATRVMHFDERGAAFYALGRARALGKPVALICTSGSAAANYWPAVVEADATGAPLLLVTADRPPELLHCGANQAIDQMRLFGGYARAAFELPCPDVAVPASYLLGTVNQACRIARGPHPGPVHINCAFREPLAPSPDGVDLRSWLAPVDAWLSGTRPFTQDLATHALPDPAAAAALLSAYPKGAIVAGTLDSDEDRVQVLRLASLMGWPVLPDFTSGLRLGESHPLAMHHIDTLLLSESFRKQFRPDFVLHVGGRVISKRLAQHLARVRPVLIHVSASPARVDPSHQATHRVVAPVAVACAVMADALDGQPRETWAQPFLKANAAVGEVLSEALARGPMTEPAVAHAISLLRPEASLLFAGNSLPVRELDSYAAATGAWGHDAANRGASGIDGNIATGAGQADALGQPATLLLGDLTTLHDLNSLALLRGERPPTAVVVINNDGGGIFSFLPVAEQREHFDSCFGTPHGMGFEHAAKQFGLAYAKPRNFDAFRDEYRHAMKERCATLIEVITSREENHRFQRALQERIASAVEVAL
jgi:2-succinyl-5-enolpyruvyl-6-hydroxy-3-cyclohexene-1-carboxylate synthase